MSLPIRDCTDKIHLFGQMLIRLGICIISGACNHITNKLAVIFELHTPPFFVFLNKCDFT